MRKLSFPGLGIGEFSVNSTAFTLFGVDVAWYGVIIATGALLAIFYVMWRAKQVGIKSDTILDIALLTLPMGVIGARLYFVLMSLDSFHHFWEIFDIRSGGLAIYGGIIGGALGVIIMTKIKKLSFLQMADLICPAVMIGQIVGRWGNFMNVEAFGTETTLPWRMGILAGGSWTYVHPTFLYESLWNLLGFLLINTFYGWKTKRSYQKYDGQIFLMVFTWYGFGRMLIEGLRTDSLYIGPLRVSQVLGGLFFLAGLSLLLYHHFTKTDMLFKPLGGKKEK
ncbi:MAG: prolipoprotein diacylglyceryl transferase [Clostridia bacterium]|nr:prolipoprotein diacylglyceryl transferase [Clostridia bacterium]